MASSDGDKLAAIHRTLAEMSPDPVVILQDDGYRYVNPRFCDVFGYTEAEATSTLTFLDLVDPSDRAAVAKRYEMRLTGEAVPNTFRLRLRTKDGRSIPCETSATAIDFDGGPADLVIVRDISERQAAAQRIDEADARLRQVINLVPYFIFSKDRTGRFILVNEALAEAYGTTVDDLLGKTDADFNPNTAEVEGFLQDDNQVMDSGQPRETEEVITDTRGRTRILRTIKIPFTLSGSGEDAVLGFSADITERKQAEAERRRIEEKMQQAQRLESLGVLAGGIAHDFNNLLVGILGNAELVRAELSAGSPLRTRVEGIVEAARRASSLTTQLLAYSGKGKFITERIDLGRMVQEMLSLLKTSVSKKVRLKCKFADDLPAISADPAQMQQVVMNLIINSAEAIGDKPGTITVRTDVEACTEAFLRGTLTSPTLEAGPYVVFEVTDSGEGIAKADLQRIFEPFFSTKFAGRGLGLSAVLGIIQGHQGTLDVKSLPGQGTTFRVFIPAAGPVAFKEPSDTPHPVCHTVLVVDDEEIVVSVAVAALKKIGLVPMIARDGHQAVEIFREHADEIGLVLLDQAMPGMGGEEAFDRMREIRPDVRVILCSGFGEQETGKRFHDKGLFGFLQKPFRISKLQDIVRIALQDDIEQRE